MPNKVKDKKVVNIKVIAGLWHEVRVTAIMRNETIQDFVQVALEDALVKARGDTETP